jgi:hypothetical protein
MHILEGMNCCLTPSLEIARVPTLVSGTTPYTLFRTGITVAVALCLAACQKPVEHTPKVAEKTAAVTPSVPKPAPTPPAKPNETETMPVKEAPKPRRKKYRPQWMEGLPNVPHSAKSGDLVWATLPNEYNEKGTLGVFRVVSVGSNTAVLRDSQGNETGPVAAALIHPTNRLDAPTLGAWVLGDRPDQHHAMGRIARIEKGDIWLDVVHSTGTTTPLFPHVQSITVATKAMGMVFWRAKPKHPWQRGWVVATGGDLIWIMADSTRVHRVQKTQVRPFSWAKQPLATGTSASCMYVTTRYHACTIMKQLQQDRYQVRWTESQAEGIVGAQHITPEALP